MKYLIFALISLFPLFVFSDGMINKGKDGLVLRGYDAVAYLEQGKAVKGNGDFAYEYAGGRWHFSTEKNRDLFAKEPARYAPQFGGYCAYGVSKGGLFDSDPEAWTVRDGKLYLNYNKEAEEIWKKDMATHIRRAEKNWPGLNNKEKR